MSEGVAEKCNKIRHIVRLRQMLRRWRNKAAASSSSAENITSGKVPSDVPAGHVAICVGSGCRRFVVRAKYLNHPIFRKLLVDAEEEYGFANQGGPLVIPCEESVFEEILRSVSRPESAANSARCINLDDFQKFCHVGLTNNRDIFGESRPLLRGYWTSISSSETTEGSPMMLVAATTTTIFEDPLV